MDMEQPWPLNQPFPGRAATSRAKAWDEAFLLPLLASPPPQVKESRSGRVPRGSL